MSITLHRGDIPADLTFGDSVAVDTETMGLSLVRDRLCVVQLSSGDGTAHVVQLGRDYDCPNLKRLLADPAVTKIFHFARFDLAMIRRSLGVTCTPVWCTKIASRLARTNTDKHGLKDLCRDLTGVEISKEQQTSDWGAATLSEQQLAYAAQDVLYLHRMRAALEGLLAREGRTELAAACFAFLPTRAALDLAGWDDFDIFAH
ncbi:ribonuclease D [Caenispirillum bisanense]|uniref:ribonuclease D n=1 Tax=Caenispirillum bisanense TaxID=414052 RepID=UPI0031D7D4B5